MALYKINGSKVSKLNLKTLDLEKNLQKIFEENLNEILDIDFLAHEYSTSSGGRIDTLGIDNNGSPCIIEYKKSHNDNVINQGLSYLLWLLDHKEKFEKLLVEKDIKIDIEWDSPRVICVAESYNKFDIDTAYLLPFTIELLKFRIYDESLLLVEPESNYKLKVATPSSIKNGKLEKKKYNLQKTYTLEHHLEKANKKAKELFEIIHEKIMSLDEDIKVEPKKWYIAYKLATNIVDITVMLGRNEYLRLFLNVPKGKLDDPKKIARDVSGVGHWGNGDYEVKVTSTTDMEVLFKLIKQSYNLGK